MHPSRHHPAPIHALIGALLLAGILAIPTTWGDRAAATTRAPAGTSLEGEAMSLQASSGRRVADAGASGGSTLLVWSNATASGPLAVDRWASELVVAARADLCGGGAEMEVAVDGAVVGAEMVESTTWRPYRFPVSLGAGSHTVSVRFTNDRYTSSCDRNLRLDRLDLRHPEAVDDFEGEAMSLPASSGRRVADAGASGGSTLLVWSNATASGPLAVDRWASELVVAARADLCGGGAEMEVAVDGAVVGAEVVESTTWRPYRFPVSLGAGSHTVAVRFTNDRYTSSCDRNLRLDWLGLLHRSSINPLAERPFHIGWVPAADAADDLRESRPVDAARLDRLADTPTARWFGEWSGDIRAAAGDWVSEAHAAEKLPVVVAYAIPQRDCGSYSAGGLTPDGYRRWIREMAAGIGDRPAVVVLEPDAVALASCLSATDRSVRYDLLADAVSALGANQSTAVYLDAGNAGWIGPDEMASRLRAAGVDRARGVSVNVSNFGTTESQTAYAEALAERLGVHAVIDTSRNGNGSDGSWCNPPGRAIGAAPTVDTVTAVVDALLWVKVPGESDGTCNGGPAAGQFWTDYALELVRNAGG